MGNTVKKRDLKTLLSPILNAFFSVIYVTKELSSYENKQDSKIDEQVKEIKDKQDSKYIAQLEENTHISGNIEKRKICVGEVRNTDKIKFLKGNNSNKQYNEEEREKRIW